MHKQTILTHPKNGEKIPVDTKLAGLISALWDAGINTYCSCYNNDKTGFGYIVLSLPKAHHRRIRAVRSQHDNKKAMTLLRELSEAANKDLWFDYGPSGAVLRFRSEDVAVLTDVMVNGV